MTGLLRLPLVRFLVVGIANTLTGLSLIFVAKWLVGVGDVAANAFGYGVGFLLSFSLNRSWTFGHQGSAGRAFMIFLAVQAAAYGFNLVTVVGLISMGVNSYLAQTLGVPPYTAISYLGSRYLAFGSRTGVGGGKARPGLDADPG